MYIYSVTIAIENETETEWLEFMQQKHIADVLKTGYFTSASMRKAVNEDNAAFVTYNIEYTADSMEAYTQYQQLEATRLQKDVADRFSGKFTAQRRVYQKVTEL
jgi:hypothetical protein